MYSSVTAVTSYVLTYVPLYVFMYAHTYVCTRRNAEHYGASVSEVADYIAAASHSSRATHAQTVSGALLCDSVAFVLARAGSGERCWRCSSLPQLFSAQFRFVGQPVSRVCANESHAIFHGPLSLQLNVAIGFTLA